MKMKMKKKSGEPSLSMKVNCGSCSVCMCVCVCGLGGQWRSPRGCRGLTAPLTNKFRRIIEIIEPIKRIPFREEDINNNIY